MPVKRDGPFWRRFLLAIDAALLEPHSIVVIGGAAIAMRYTETHLTDDLDAISTRDDALWLAVERAREKVRAAEGLAAPEPLVQRTGVYDAPWQFEDRLQKLRVRRLRHLQVFVPERHDLALMKTARGQERDVTAIVKMHRARKFQIRTLVERYREMLAGATSAHREHCARTSLSLSLRCSVTTSQRSLSWNSSGSSSAPSLVARRGGGAEIGRPSGAPKERTGCRASSPTSTTSRRCS